MKRGTRVGQAYVSVTADGDGINEEITKEFDEAGPGVEKAGEDHGDKYSEGFFSRLRDKLHSRLNDENGGIFNSSGAGKSGARAGDDFLKNFTENITRKSEGALAQMLENIESGFGNSGDKSGSSFLARLRARIADSKVVSGNILDSITKDDGRSNQRMDRLIGDLREARKQTSLLEKGLSEVTGGRNDRDIGTRIGSILGAGSRNNFLNFFGKSLGNIVNLADKGRVAATTLFDAFKTGFSQAGEDANLFQKILSGISGAGSSAGGGISALFSSIAASGPAAAVAIAVVVVALSAMASVLAALLALLTAVIATIASAFVGALLVAGGAVGALVVAGGLLVAMFTSLTDAQKKFLAADFAPLKNEFIGLGQILFAQVSPALGAISKNLQEALYLAAPLAEVLGTAFAQAGTALSASFSGPGFTAFFQSLSVYLPAIVQNLSVGLGSFLNGLTGLFATLMPYVFQFSGYLADVAQRFSNFVNSPEGNNKIVDFVDRALMSLQSLWNATKQVFGFISDLLFNPDVQDAGNTVFDGIATAFENLRQNLAQASADGSLKKFFQDAISFGSGLWDVIQGLIDVFMALYNSGLLGDITYLLSAFGKGLQKTSGFLQGFVTVLDTIINPIGLAVDAFKALGGGVGGVVDFMKSKFNSSAQDTQSWVSTVYTSIAAGLKLLGAYQGAVAAANVGANPQNYNGPAVPTLPNLIHSGSVASAASNLPKIAAAKPKKYVLPKKYLALANSLLKNDNIKSQIADTLTSVNKQAGDALSSAATADTSTAAVSAVSGVVDAMKDAGKSTIDAAQNSLNTAAQSLKSSTSKKQTKQALADIKTAQTQMAAAVAAQNKLNAAAATLSAQNVIDPAKVANLVAGLGGQNITLAEFAAAREQLAVKISDANKALADAISLRDNYFNSVTDAAKSFAALTTAQAQTIDGVQQALTAGDITANLQDKLDKIKHFQEELTLLRAQGLSDAAYKQIVDAGVDGGTQYADALLAGGVGAIQQTNGLVDQIDKASTLLGTQASDSLYAAGVAAAQGLVDGLTSLSAQLDSAAASLGTAIANQIKATLGIASPSKVAFGLMGNFGDGMVLGLTAAQVPVSAAAQALADRVAVASAVPSPPGGVSGNDVIGGPGTAGSPYFRDLVVHTPTEDPRAAGIEAVNELVGRLPG